MTAAAELLIDGLGRVRESVHAAVSGLSTDQLAYRVDQDANSIAWLVWHLTRVADDHIADAFGEPQVWGAWSAQFALPFEVGETGYGHGSAAVAAVRAPGSVLTGYHDAVHEQAVGLVSLISDADLDRVVDRRWDPPVTLGVRLVSVIDDCTQHAGQAAFVRGIVLRANLLPRCGRLGGGHRHRFPGSRHPRLAASTRHPGRPGERPTCKRPAWRGGRRWLSRLASARIAVTRNPAGEA